MGRWSMHFASSETEWKGNRMIFRGICIGGIADGEQRSFDSPKMEIAARPKLVSFLVASQQEPSEMASITKEIYTFLPLWGMQIGFWVLESVAAQGVEYANEYVMRRLTESYLEARKR